MPLERNSIVGSSSHNSTEVISDKFHSLLYGPVTSNVVSVTMKSLLRVPHTITPPINTTMTTENTPKKPIIFLLLCGNSYRCIQVSPNNNTEVNRPNPIKKG